VKAVDLKKIYIFSELYVKYRRGVIWTETGQN